MGRGASYRPQYGNNWVSPPAQPDVWPAHGNQYQHTEQGDHVSFNSPTSDAYAIVDAWRSYREDQITLSGEHNNLSLSPQASRASPADVLNNYLQLQSTSHFKRYQPLRFSNGASEAQLVQGLRNSGLNPPYAESRHSYSTRSTGPVVPLQNPICDYQLPSIEPWEDYAIKAQALPKEIRRNDACRNTLRRTPQRTVSPPPAPEASEIYLAQARLPPMRRSAPKKCLVILDLNGTCIARPNVYQPKFFKVRPGIYKLFEYLFEHHVVMIFTSMRRDNAAAILDKLFTPSQRQKLAGFWARDKLGLTAEQVHVKTQTYKNLIPIWLDKDIQSTHPRNDGKWGWDQSNTVLIDDSHLKAVSHPHNLLLVPEFSKQDAAKEKLHHDVEKSEGTILWSLIVQLDELRYQTDVSRVILQWQSGKAPIPRQARRVLVTEEKPTSTSEASSQLLTPESTIDTLSEDSQDDEVHRRMGAEMKKLTYEDRRERGVSEVPETVWADLLSRTDDKA